MPRNYGEEHYGSGPYDPGSPDVHPLRGEYDDEESDCIEDFECLHDLDAPGEDESDCYGGYPPDYPDEYPEFDD